MNRRSRNWNWMGLMVMLAVAFTAALLPPAQAFEQPDAGVVPSTVTNAGLVWYAVGKKVSTFSTNRDLSTPEAAYATFNRVSASGDQTTWWELSGARIASQRPDSPPPRSEVSRKAAYEWLNSEIIEVWIYRTNFAAVIARIPHPTKRVVDIREFSFERRRWLNEGESIAKSLEEARQIFTRHCAARDALANRTIRPVQ
jgi:hypothetical protein